MFPDINLGQIEDNPNYNFINKYDEENELFSDNFHSCDYYEIGAIKKNLIVIKMVFPHIHIILEV